MWAVLASIGGGILGQLLFFGELPGINVSIWVVAVLVTAVALRPRDARLDRLDFWLPVAAVAFALFIALRDDGPLVLFDILAAGALTLAAVVALGGREVSRTALGQVVRLGTSSLFVAWTGAVRLAPGAGLLGSSLRPSSGSKPVRIARGLLLAVPLLLLFVALFAAADAVFETYVRQVVAADIDWPQLMGRVVLALLAGWLFAGTMVCAWLAESRTQPAADAPARLGRIGDLEAVVLLGAIDAIFAVFVILQAAYLFGGLDTLAVTGMTYSEYARRGFFELIAVALLAGGVILVIDALVAARTRAYRIAAVLLAGLTGVVLVSAVARLGMYQAAYGWTELRFYALAAIGWLAVGVVVAIAALVIGRVAMVWRVMLGAGFAVAVACNAIGPQSFVTQQNVARAVDPSLVAAGGVSGLDVDYLAGLGADAIPVLVANFDRLPADAQAAVRALLSSSASRLSRQVSQHGWPSWNMARTSASEALRAAGY
jgi:hypothetical protein